MMQGTTMEDKDITRIFELQKSNRWKAAHTNAQQRITKLKRLKQAVLNNVKVFRRPCTVIFENRPMK